MGKPNPQSCNCRWYVAFQYVGWSPCAVSSMMLTRGSISCKLISRSWGTPLMPCQRRMLWDLRPLARFCLFGGRYKAQCRPLHCYEAQRR